MDEGVNNRCASWALVKDTSTSVLLLSLPNCVWQGEEDLSERWCEPTSQFDGYVLGTWSIGSIATRPLNCHGCKITAISTFAVSILIQSFPFNVTLSEQREWISDRAPLFLAIAPFEIRGWIYESVSWGNLWFGEFLPGSVGSWLADRQIEADWLKPYLQNCPKLTWEARCQQEDTLCLTYSFSPLRRILLVGEGLWLNADSQPVTRVPPNPDGNLENVSDSSARPPPPPPNTAAVSPV